ncbi:MAG: hypothetical protein ACMUEM_01745 [Flavobacteriales bacterium AspAUS03]
MYNNTLVENKNTLRLTETQEKLLKIQMGMNIDQTLNIIGKINEKILNDIVPHLTDSAFYKKRIEYTLDKKQW